MSGLVKAERVINKTINLDEIMLYANTTNGPSYVETFCINCQNRIATANFKVQIDK